METIIEEITTNSNRKETLGLRCTPELKFKLTAKAKKLGITLSEYCANILSNNESVSIEKDNALNDVRVINQKILSLVASSNEEKTQHKSEIQKSIMENERIKNEAQSIKAERDKFKKEMVLFKSQSGQNLDKIALIISVVIIIGWIAYDVFKTKKVKI